MLTKKFPDFLKKKYIWNDTAQKVQDVLANSRVNTVCREAQCPNKCECFSKNHLTFMILGKNCSRNCSFCGVSSLPPEKINTNETKEILDVIKQLGLKKVIITSVTRDDLPTKGVDQFVDLIQEIKNYDRSIFVEILVPDFQANTQLIDRFKNTIPDIYGHNIETVPRLYSLLKKESDFSTSLSALAYASSLGCLTKSGIMVGLGETKQEVFLTLLALYQHGVRYITLGQYLQPKGSPYSVKRFVLPSEFYEYETIAKSIGFEHVLSSPFARSSYCID